MGQPLTMQNDPFEPHAELIGAYGFVPNLFRGQNDLPRVVEARNRLIDAVVTRENSLSRRQKDSLLHGVASAWRNDGRRALPGNASAAAEDSALLKFALKLAKHAPWFSGNDVEALRMSGFGDVAILEAVATTAVGQLLCTLADGLRPSLDPGLVVPARSQPVELPESLDWVETPGPYLGSTPRLADDFPPYVVLREQFGFVPNIFRDQGLRPDVVDAEVQALERILFPEDHLSRVQKESILLVLSAANLNTYFVAVHTQILGALGVSQEDADQIVTDYHQAAISLADMALLDEVRKLARSIARPGVFDTNALQTHGFTEPQIVEAVAMAALTNFLNTLQAGLGPVPDFPPRRVFTPKDLYPRTAEPRPTSDGTPSEDPDAALVVQVQNGDTDVFEELVRRHTRRVFKILAGLVGNMDDARDATQDVFLKAFEHIGRFQGRSRFSTWLITIAVNTGTQLLRERKPSESLDEVDEDEGFRPRQIQSWADNPEQQFAASQRSYLVREAVLQLPEKYRIVVLLRDMNQLSTEEAAAALGLSVPALKARLLRGRLMLRESLAVHFVRADRGSRDAQLR